MPVDMSNCPSVLIWYSEENEQVKANESSARKFYSTIGFTDGSMDLQMHLPVKHADKQQKYTTNFACQPIKD